MQGAGLRTVADFRINVISARRCVRGAKSELPLPDGIRPGAEFRNLENFAQVTVIRIGVIIKPDLDDRSIRNRKAELKKVSQRNTVALGNGVSGLKVEFD